MGRATELRVSRFHKSCGGPGGIVLGKVSLEPVCCYCTRGLRGKLHLQLVVNHLASFQALHILAVIFGLAEAAWVAGSSRSSMYSHAIDIVIVLQKDKLVTRTPPNGDVMPFN